MESNLLAALNGLNSTRAGLFFLNVEKCDVEGVTPWRKLYRGDGVHVVQLFSISVLLSVLQVTLCHHSAPLKSCIATTCWFYLLVEVIVALMSGWKWGWT